MIIFMRRMALICAVLWLTPQATATAQAAYLNEAVQALQSGNVYVSVQVADINTATKEQLIKQADANNVAVVALPEAAATEAGGNPTEFALSIARSTGDSTLVLAIGDDLVAVSRNLQPGVAAKLADQAEADAGSTGEALLNFIAEVREAKPSSPGSQPIADSDGSGFLLIGWIALVVILSGLGVLGLKGRRKKPVEYASAPPDIRKLLSENRELGASIKNSAIQRSLAEGERHTNQLFYRLNQTGSDKIQQITGTYAGHLESLNEILVRYKDVEVNAEYFPEADVVLKDGLQAVQRYEAGVLQNTREVASGSLTNFRVNAKLLSAMQTTDDPKL